MMNQRGTDRSTPRFFMTLVIELNTKTKPGGGMSFWCSTRALADTGTD